MNTNSIETQQNAIKTQQHLRIAQIYQRMLLGDRSALSNLQKIKIHTNKHAYVKSMNSTQYNETLLQSKKLNTSRQDTVKTNSHIKQPIVQKNSKNESQKLVTPEFRHNNKSIHETTSQSKQKPVPQSQKTKEKFRSYIKNKVNELRNEKEYLKNKQEKQLNQIKKISQRIKINQFNSDIEKSVITLELVKRKSTLNNQNRNENSSHKKKRKQHSISNYNNTINNQAHHSNEKNQRMRKVQSSSQNKVIKRLPPINQKKKIPTEFSQKNPHQKSYIASRQQVSTPINLAKQSETQQFKKALIQEKLNHNAQPLKSSKIQKSRIKKISLPQMKKQRQDLSKINQDEKAFQLDLIQYHHQTKNFIEQIKTKYNLNFRNQNLLKDCHTIIQPIVIRKNQQEAKIGIAEPLNKKKKITQLLEQKVQKSYNDIRVLQDIIQLKRKQLQKIKEKSSRNLLNQYWEEYDLHNSNFSQDYTFEDDILAQDDISLKKSKLTSQAYSTAMVEKKHKNWRWAKMKQYDTNRSFQQPVKSRSMLKQSKIKKQGNSLNKIQQNDEDMEENSPLNKVIVNSRLKKLLLS